MHYQQDEKNESRIKLLTHAIDSLTINRSNSLILDQDHIKNSIEWYFGEIEKYTNFDTSSLRNITSKSFQNWEKYYTSITKSKNPEDLKVLFLSGPEPKNDIEILIENGVLVQNIYAIESSKKEYNKALESLISDGLFVKIHKGTIQDFLKMNDMVFDIIYLDFCSPIISNNDPLKTITELFSKDRLTPLSALITNFSEANISTNNISEIITSWYSWRNEDEFPEDTFSLFGENFDRVRFNTKDKRFEDQFELIYGDFIRSFIGVLSTEIIPMWKTMNKSSNKNKYFDNDAIKKYQKKIKDSFNEPIKNEKDFDTHHEWLSDMFSNIPDLYMAKSSYKLINWSEYIQKYIDKSNPIYKLLFDSNGEKINCATSIYFHTILKSLTDSLAGLPDFYKEVCNDDLLNIFRSIHFYDDDIRVACSSPSYNLIAELMLGIYGQPYIPNSELHKSLTYKAQTNRMFSDVFIFDKCRYLYDFLPSFEMLPKFFNDFGNQLVLHSCIDGIIRKSLSFNRDFFDYGFLNVMFNDYSKMYSLKGREIIN